MFKKKKKTESKVKTSIKKAAKKVSKKASKKATKKTSQKSSPKKRSAQNEKAVLVCANGEQCFWTTDGRVLSNIVELRDSLESMADEVFQHHVTNEKNDFADWVESVLMDAELASSLRRSRKPSSAKTVVVRRLKVYDY